MEKLDIVLIGLNHKTAPVELRECLAFNNDEEVWALDRFKRHPRIKEVVLFSTCNRVEILLTSPDAKQAVADSMHLLEEMKGVGGERFKDSLYVHINDNAVRHLFRVAASLDSLVVGEPQILGQIKESYAKAVSQKTSGVILNRLLHRTFFVAKRVRSETGIGDHAVSISYAAIELGRKIFGSLEGKTVLLMGAGEMAELAVEHLMRHRAGKFFVANRTFERAVELARRFKGKAIHFEETGDFLQVADIIISSTGSPDYVIRKDQVKKNMRGRRNRPLFFIDIAVPRDIDPDIHKLDNAYVYDIDDLKDVVDENIEDRKKEAVKAERIIDEAVIRFRKWLDSLDVVPTIVAIRKKMNDIAKAELNKTFGSLSHLSEEDRQAMDRMIQSIIKKFLHDPTILLKNNAFRGDKTLYLDIVQKLFQLEDQLNPNVISDNINENEPFANGETETSNDVEQGKTLGEKVRKLH